MKKSFLLCFFWAHWLRTPQVSHVTSRIEAKHNQFSSLETVHSPGLWPLPVVTDIIPKIGSPLPTVFSPHCAELIFAVPEISPGAQKAGKPRFPGVKYLFSRLLMACGSTKGSLVSGKWTLRYLEITFPSFAEKETQVLYPMPSVVRSA